MLRSDEERAAIHIRPDPDWNRARMVEWIVSQVKRQTLSSSSLSLLLLLLFILLIARFIPHCDDVAGRRCC